MIIGAISGQGVLLHMRVPPNVKINSERYVEDAFKALGMTHLLKLYPGEEGKVYIHHDAAFPHTAKKIQAYAEEVKEKFRPTLIKNFDIPVKSSDISSLDFFGSIF